MNPTALKSKNVALKLLHHSYFKGDKIYIIGSATAFEFLRPHKNEISFVTEEEAIRRRFDFVISIGWGKKISSEIIDRALIAAINCHGSLLPDYRGADIYKHYFANCEAVGGCTIHHLAEEFDAGGIVAQKTFSICWYDTPRKILEKTSEATFDCLVAALPKLVENPSYQFENNLNAARYFFQISKYKMFAYKLINLALKSIFGVVVSTPYKKISDK